MSNNNLSTQWKDHFSQFENSLNGQKSNPLHNYRKKAFEALDKRGFPGVRDEDWKYTNPSSFSDPSFTPSFFKNSEESNNLLNDTSKNDLHFKFVNGQLVESPENLPSGLKIISLEKAILNPATSEWVESILNKIIQKNDAFPLMNLSYLSDGILIEIDKNTSIEPSLIFHSSYTDNEDLKVFNPLILVKAETSSNINIIEKLEGEGNFQSIHNSLSFFQVKKNANVSICSIQTFPYNYNSVNVKSVEQERDSVFTHIGVDIGGAIVRNNIDVTHLGENIESNLFGLSIVNGTQHIDTQTFIDHALPNCQSNELYKNIIMEKGKGVFNGKVLVRQDAQKTNAYQQNANLVLDKTASMNAKPQLEIYADDVKCSHGATIGQLDERAIYYLMARGLDREQARNLLKEGFLGEVLLEIKNEELREHISSLIKKKLNK